ncbi:MAG: cobalt ECF transporter T component CbiQ [Marinobacter sp.]|uniref:cobalt ECF transporter T component CbiQ n=1 Tax=Marinobacter sp. TaxID=50741 RepID=UPI0034A0740B
MSSITLQLCDGQQSWLTQRDPRTRVITAVLFSLATVSLDHLGLLTTALIIAVSTALAAGLRPLLLLKRIAALETFMLVMLGLLPFTTPGAPVFSVGALTASEEGLTLALTIILKANAVVLMLLALVGTLEPVVLGHALARLRIPAKLVHLFLLTVRYISVLHDEYQSLRRAMRARAFTPRSNFHTWRSLGNLLGMLLVRSLERSQRVMAAMKCRGFDGRFYLLNEQCWQWRDSLMLFSALTTLSLLVILELLL